MNQMNRKNVLYLKPRQRKRPNPKRPKTPLPSAWQPHQSEYAIDPWGVAVRVLKERNVQFSE